MPAADPEAAVAGAARAAGRGAGGRRSDVVHERLRGDILEGRLAPGAAVASERALAEELDVNRHAVREALKRLQQAGLVRITQGGATRVQDWRDSAGLDVLLDLVRAPDGREPPRALLRAVLEMRESIGVDAARRCAARAAPQERQAIAGLARTAADTVRGGAGPAIVDEAYAACWRAVVAGSGNLAYRLALTSLVQALDAHPEVADVVRPSDADGLDALGSAIAGADAAGAAAAARRLLEPDALAFG